MRALLAVLLAFLPHLQGQLYRACLVQNPGFVNCTVGAAQSAYKGLDVDVILTVGESLGWTQVESDVNASQLTGPAFTLVCTDLRVAPIIDLLSFGNNDTSVCTMGAGAFTVTPARVRQGVQFAWTHMHSSLGVMVAAGTESEQTNKWAFMRPFSWELWFVLVGSTVITPLLLSIFENLIQTGHLPVGMSLLTEWRHAIYTMFLCCFNLQVLEVVSAPCQLIIICFAFTNLILVASYTANLAAALTSEAVNTGINAVSDLVGRKVAAHTLYLDSLWRNKQIRASPLVWAGLPTFDRVKEELLNRDIDAYIFDMPILKYYMAEEDPSCELKMIKDDSVEPFDYGIAFHHTVSQEVVRNFTWGVLQAKLNGMLNTLEDRWLSGTDLMCGAQANDSNVKPLQVNQISGLFIILGSAAGLGLLCSIYAVWFYHSYLPRKAKQAAAAQAAAQAAQLKASSVSQHGHCGPSEPGVSSAEDGYSFHHIILEQGGQLPLEERDGEGDGAASPNASSQKQWQSFTRTQSVDETPRVYQQNPFLQNCRSAGHALRNPTLPPLPFLRAHSSGATEPAAAASGMMRKNVTCAEGSQGSSVTGGEANGAAMPTAIRNPGGVGVQPFRKAAGMAKAMKRLASKVLTAPPTESWGHNQDGGTSSFRAPPTEPISVAKHNTFISAKTTPRDSRFSETRPVVPPPHASASDGRPSPLRMSQSSLGTALSPTQPMGHMGPSQHLGHMASMPHVGTAQHMGHMEPLQEHMGHMGPSQQYTLGHMASMQHVGPSQQYTLGHMASILHVGPSQHMGPSMQHMGPSTQLVPINPLFATPSSSSATLLPQPPPNVSSPPMTQPPSGPHMAQPLAGPDMSQPPSGSQHATSSQRMTGLQQAEGIGGHGPAQQGTGNHTQGVGNHTQGVGNHTQGVGSDMQGQQAAGSGSFLHPADGRPTPDVGTLPSSHDSPAS